MLHADNFLTVILGDRVPNGHIVRGQVQLVGAWQRIVSRERVGEGWDGLV
jgi:hypothetical protein